MSATKLRKCLLGMYKNKNFLCFFFPDVYSIVVFYNLCMTTIDLLVHKNLISIGDDS